MQAFTLLGKLSPLSLKSIISDFIDLYSIFNFSQAKTSNEYELK